MAFDLKFDFQTGDIVLAPNHDLAGVSGDSLTAQRIMLRIMIERGTFEFDDTGTLGSRVMLLARSLGNGIQQAASQAVREALEPMTDIRVTRVDVEFSKRDDGTLDERAILVQVSYTPLDEVGEAVIPDVEFTAGQVEISLV